MSRRLNKPARFKSFLEWAEAAYEVIMSNRVIAGPGIRIRKSLSGCVISANSVPRFPLKTAGPFCKVYRTETEWKLLGGNVTGSEGAVTLADVTIGTIGSEPADGTFYWLACDVTGNEEDDVLLPGCELTAATPGNGTSLPSSTVPTVGALSGQIHVSLGEWMSGVFTPAGCGDIQIGHCPGTLHYTRL
jgi:hypothetical protein